LSFAVTAAFGHVGGEGDEQAFLLMFGQPHSCTIWQTCFTGVNHAAAGALTASVLSVALSYDNR
jgi:hypothetical protein